MNRSRRAELNQQVLQRLDQSLGPATRIVINDHTESGWFNCSGKPPVSISIRQTGTGSDLVLLHGIGASAAIYRTLVPLLKRKYRVTTVDWIGFGESDKPLDPKFYRLESQAEALKRVIQFIAPATAVHIGASSMGGAISTWSFSAQGPMSNQPVRLTLFAPALFPRAIPRWIVWIAAVCASSLVALVAAALLRWTKFGPWFFRRACEFVVARSTAVNHEFVEFYSRPYLCVPFRESVRAIRAFFLSIHLLADSRVSDALHTVNGEKQILAGTEDHLVPLQQLKTLIHLSNAPPQWVELENFGHHPMEDNPDQMRELIEQLDSRP